MAGRAFQMTALLVMIPLTGIGATTQLPPIYDATLISKQTVTAGGITAIVRVGAENSWGNYSVYGMWGQPSGGHYAIGCLNVYRSLKYELRDSAGHVAQINQKKLSQGEPITEGGRGAEVYRADCSPFPPHESVMLLTDLHDPTHQKAFGCLFPDLRPGQYTLEITFAPAGISETATLKPVSITIPAK